MCFNLAKKLCRQGMYLCVTLINIDGPTDNQNLIYLDRARDQREKEFPFCRPINYVGMVFDNGMK